MCYNTYYNGQSASESLKWERFNDYVRYTVQVKIQSKHLRKVSEVVLVDRPVKVNDHCMDALRYSVMKLRDKNKISGAAKNVGIQLQGVELLENRQVGVKRTVYDDGGGFADYVVADTK